MKRILFILLSFILLQGSASCIRNNNGQKGNSETVIINDDSPNELSPEQQTEENLYRFVQEVVEKSVSKSPTALVCTDFLNEIEAFNQIINMINPASDREKFDQRNRYASDYLRMQYKETDGESGFAKCSLIFKNREEPKRYTIVFTTPK